MRALKAIKCFIISISLLTALLAPQTAAAQGEHQSVGLVLSGGGAKGIAHVGVIKALEENNIPIDYVTGTSMGAIIGGLYACGYTPEEMMELMCSQYFMTMSAGKYDPALTYYFSKPASSPQIFSLPLGGKAGSSKNKSDFNPQSLIAPTPMAFGFMEIFSPYTAQCRGDFDRLMVPFRCVASNMTDRRKQVMSGGNLGDAIRASMSFPLVFQAVKIDGNILYDGGIYDNFPVDVMETEFAPAMMLGVDVSASSKGEPNSFMEQLDLLVSMPQSYAMPERKGPKLRVDLNDYTLLDFDKAQAIYKRGYDTAMAMMDSIKARVTARTTPEATAVRRAVFKANTPPLRFNKVNVTGGARHQDEYIAHLFRPRNGCDTIGADHARLSFYHAVSSGKIQSLTPTAVMTPGDSTGYFTLNLRARIKPRYTLGVGGYITSSNNSYFYGRAGYSSLSFHSLNADLELWAGQSYLAAVLRASYDLPTAVPSAFRFMAVASRRKYYEDEKLFFRDNEPTFVNIHQYFGRLSWNMAAGRTGDIGIGVAGGRIYNTFYENNSVESYRAGRNHVSLDLGQAFVEYRASTLNDLNFPTSGFERRAVASAVYGRARYFEATRPEGHRDSRDNTGWLQLRYDSRHYLGLHRHWALGLEGHALLSSRKLLKNYYSTITTAPAFYPTPASHNVFDPKLRSYNYVAFGAVPVYKYNDNLSARVSANAYMPLRRVIEGADGSVSYGSWFGSVQFFGELDLVFHLPFASISAYCNYATSTGDVNVGVALGIYITAPKFLE